MLFVVVAFAATVGLSAAPAAAQYTPEHPVVKAMVNKAIKYLEGVKEDELGAGLTDFDGSGGARVLLGYAHYKVRHDPENAVVKRGVVTALAITDAIAAGQGDHGHKKNYEIAMCILLLAEVDPDKYEAKLKILQEHLFESQSAHGGWAYPGDKDGDVSQTQYALLATWTLDRNGIPLDYERVVGAMNWLLRVQDIKGGWPYHGEDPGPGRLIAQTKVDTSMSLAGGSSLLIAGDALGLWGRTAVDESDPGVPGLPEAIKLYVEDKNERLRKRVKLSDAPIWTALRAMNQWRAANPYKRTARLDWFYYQLYTLERYESFIEISQGKVKDKSPPWYNQGVEELKSTQDPSGGWLDRSYSQGPVSTSFAVLFLIRSTQRAVFNVSSGSLAGGQGLPSDTTQIQVDGTQIKGRPVAEDLASLLSILEEDGADDLAGQSLPDDMVLFSEPKARAVQLDRLERLVRGSNSWQARRVAARVLATSDELRVVPALIFALSDEDPLVWKISRDGLRFLSRKFDGFGLEPAPDEAIPTRRDVTKVQREWRNWYLSTNPKYVFLDYDL